MLINVAAMDNLDPLHFPDTMVGASIWKLLCRNPTRTAENFRPSHPHVANIYLWRLADGVGTRQVRVIASGCPSACPSVENR